METKLSAGVNVSVVRYDRHYAVSFPALAGTRPALLSSRDVERSLLLPQREKSYKNTKPVPIARQKYRQKKHFKYLLYTDTVCQKHSCILRTGIPQERELCDFHVDGQWLHSLIQDVSIQDPTDLGYGDTSKLQGGQQSWSVPRHLWRKVGTKLDFTQEFSIHITRWVKCIG